MGGYYWFPTPTGGGTTWAVLTCHDLGQGPDVGHVDLWPAVVDRFAAAWGRDARALRRRLIDRYTGLPRGRVTRPGRTFLILHGDDAPVIDWRERLVGGFRLGGRPHRFLYDEHERMLTGDPERVGEVIGEKPRRAPWRSTPPWILVPTLQGVTGPRSEGDKLALLPCRPLDPRPKGSSSTIDST